MGSAYVSGGQVLIALLPCYNAVQIILLDDIINLLFP
jgi:hypothetical protein